MHGSNFPGLARNDSCSRLDLMLTYHYPEGIVITQLTDEMVGKLVERPRKTEDPRVKAVDIPTTMLGKTGVEVSVIAQGGARMDLHPDIQTAADHVRQVYGLGITYFDCARNYWDGRAEEAYGIGLEGVRNDVFLTTKTQKRTASEAEQDLAISLRLLKTDHLDLWQVHAVDTLDEVNRILGPGGAIEAFEAAKKAGKCRFIGFTGHYDPAVHAAMLRAYDGWDTVMMPIHAADHAYLSFEETALPVAIERSQRERLLIAGAAGREMF